MCSTKPVGGALFINAPPLHTVAAVFDYNRRPYTMQPNATRLYLDTETRSPVDLSKVGAYAYAEQAELLLIGWAMGKDPVQVHDCTRADAMPDALAKALSDPRCLIYAHNSTFDRLVLKANGYDVPAERWIDTAMVARAHSLPASLAQLGAHFFGQHSDKTKESQGKALLRLFCTPTRNGGYNNASTHPEQWSQFIAYCAQDVTALREIVKRLPSFNLTYIERYLWVLDQRINDRGFAVDTALVDSALSAIEAEQLRLDTEIAELTDGAIRSTRQTGALAGFLDLQLGVNLGDLQKSTVEEALQRLHQQGRLSGKVRAILENRSQSSKSSTSKYKALKNGVNRDGRMRGTLLYCGAQRTGRWAGRLFQPQNLPRPSMQAEQIEAGIDALKAGTAPARFANIMQLTSDALRGTIVAPEGKKLVVADLSNIEGRVLAWLSGEQWKLKAFDDYDKGTGHDLYKLAYASSFGVPPESVTKEQRQIGKVQELALGYEGGVGAFLQFAKAYGMDLEAMADLAWPTLPSNLLISASANYHRQLATNADRFAGLSQSAFVVCDVFKTLWRNAHPATVKLWRQLSDAFQQAVGRDASVTVGEHLTVIGSKGHVYIRLPSGRSLAYYDARVIENGQLQFYGVNSTTKQWGRINTYSGKLAENVTQAVARDVLGFGALMAEASGYEVVLSVHDELITETPDSSDFSAEQLAALMCVAPEWAKGLPLSASGFSAKRYRKD